MIMKIEIDGGLDIKARETLISRLRTAGLTELAYNDASAIYGNGSFEIGRGLHKISGVTGYLIGRSLTVPVNATRI